LVKNISSLICALFLLSACQTSEVLEARTVVENVQPSKFASVVIDGNSGKSVYAVAASEQRFPASLTKMMTLYLLFEAMDAGRISKVSLMSVSPNAASQPPSKIGLKAGSTIDVDTAIRAVSVKSANDISVVIAETLSGTEEQFAVQMTNKARALGMARTTFRNASGLHDPLQVTTATDMARLGLALRQKFPHYFGYFSLREMNVSGRTVTGHNKVLDMVSGADGIKTGYTKASGFNLVTSVSRNGKLLIAVIMGEDNAKQRDARMAALVMTNMGRVN
jgi:D-alanyl-D-alanine carboxypeptidase